MKLKALSAAIAATLSINAGAVVLTPSASGGSEFVLFVGGAYPDGGTVQFSQDLGIQAGSFDFTQSHSWKLDSGFNEFLNPNRYDPDFTDAPGQPGIPGCNGLSNGLICGNAPNPGAGDPGDFQVRWGVTAADNTSGASKVYVTWADENEFEDPSGDLDKNTNGYQTTLTTEDIANQINNKWTAGTSSAIRELNERAAHANNTNGADLFTLESNYLDPSAPFGGTNTVDPSKQQDVNSSLSQFGSRQFNDIEATLDLKATLDEQVAMFLYESASPDAVAQGDGTNIGKWYFDYTNGWLVYEVLGSPIPAPVPVPAAVWLLGSALVGLTGISRRRTV